MTSRRWSRALALALAAVLVATVSACGVTRDGTDPENRRLRMMIPNSPGGGYDLTGRSAAQVMEQDGLTGRFEINNVIGASGTVAMQRLLNEKGSDDVMLLMGLGVVGAVFTNRSDATVDRATPVAGLVAEAEGILVPADSPFQSVDDLVAAWTADPGSVTVGGGSSPGGPDHLFPMQLAQTIGIDPNDVNYIAYDGGGPLTTALLGEKIDVGMSGLGEFQGQIDSGELRVLAVSGAERLETVDAPTLQEEGVDLEFLNWRGVLAPPGISEEARQGLVDLLTEMHDTPEWEDALERNGWIDNFMVGEEFEEFLIEQNNRVESTLKELGLA
ncbi:MAG: tripartite tricarboxylate transporter substrate-binding protein [Aeromicrobium sp.]|uniref:Bug family tripartite tricarboxylate transporter substrate binding protein n=1 Tax=Aeromicrobium sp. TaxID=1871063 RepID=UPI002615A67D|nr:tripartite tricarboxylate transporter substrate-binding protein [Aeromicrobium sp.]MDF1705893.1 tripartite tricarboxylate transporter substrate-binding protein [Aeromicrobium sp.]